MSNSKTHTLTVLLLAAVCAGFLAGCTPTKRPQGAAEQSALLQRAFNKPLPPEKTQELVETVGENWLCGEGLGNTAIMVGTIAAFPPSAILFVGNSLLSLAGFETIGVGTFLPDEEKKQFDRVYSSIASGPGRVAAAIAGEEFRSSALAKEKVFGAIGIDDAGTPPVAETLQQDDPSSERLTYADNRSGH